MVRPVATAAESPVSSVKGDNMSVSHDRCRRAGVTLVVVVVAAAESPLGVGMVSTT